MSAIVQVGKAVFRVIRVYRQPSRTGSYMAMEYVVDAPVQDYFGLKAKQGARHVFQRGICPLKDAEDRRQFYATFSSSNIYDCTPSEHQRYYQERNST